jgi:hypothetical protein
MKSFFANIRKIAVAGFLFLLPVYVLLVIITKAWASLSSVGTGLAIRLWLNGELRQDATCVGCSPDPDLDWVRIAHACVVCRCVQQRR